MKSGASDLHITKYREEDLYIQVQFFLSIPSGVYGVGKWHHFWGWTVSVVIGSVDRQAGSTIGLFI